MQLGVMPRLGAYYFFYFTFIGIFMPYFGLYLQAEGFPASDIGILMSVMQVMRLVAPNLWGWLGDHLGRSTPVIRLSALLSLFGFGAVMLSQGFWPLLCALGLMSFFWTATMPLLEALTLANLGRQSAHYGRIRAWGSLGFIVAVLGTGALLERAPINSILAACFVALLSILVASFLLPDQRVDHREARQAQGVMAVLRRPEVIALLVAAFLMSAAHGAFYVFYSIHLVDAGYSKLAVGLLWALGVGIEVAVFMLAPRLMKPFSLRTMMLLCFAAAILRFLIIGWCAEWGWLIVLGQCLHGLTFGAYHLTAVAAVHRWFGEGHQSLGQALYGSMSFGAGGIVGGALSGYLWDGLGAGWTFTAGSVFALLGLLVLLAGWKRGGPAECGVHE